MAIDLKPSDTAMANSTTFVSSGTIGFSPQALETWIFRAVIFYTGFTAGDIKIRMAGGGAGSTMQWTVIRPTGDTSIPLETGFIRGQGGQGDGVDGDGADLTTTIYPYILEGVMTAGAVAQAVVVEWAQLRSHATNTVFKANSYVWAEVV